MNTSINESHTANIWDGDKIYVNNSGYMRSEVLMTEGLHCNIMTSDAI
jgi:hypothetical protein